MAMQNQRVLFYVNRFKEIYGGTPWYGEPFSKKVNDVSHEIAFISPHQGMHAIVQVVAHMTYWRKGLIARLTGDKNFQTSVKSKDNWPGLDRLNEAGWQSVRSDFDRSQETISDLLNQRPDSLLATEYAEGSTFEYRIQGIIDHDIYHIGQIGVIKALVLALQKK
jgi:uncharacterized damage-inducible protein DinB